jgi:hypothetical protein
MIEKDQPVSDAAIDEIFRRLDPPEAYGKHSALPPAAPNQPTAPSGEPRICPEARKGAIWIALGILAESILFVGMFGVTHEISYPSGQAPPPPPVSKPWAMIIIAVLGIASIVSPIAGTWLGWVGVERIRNSAGRLYGHGLAAIEALLYPIALAWTAGFMIWYFIIVAYYDGTDVPNRGRAIWMIGGASTAVVFSVLLIWLLARSTRPRRTDATPQSPQRAGGHEAFS